MGTLALMPNCSAENSPIVRDCSFASTQGGSVDADFVVLAGGTLRVGANGALTVLPSQNSLVLTASESVDTGDNAGTVTLSGSVAAPGIPTQKFFGTGTGHVIWQLPLNGSSSSVGRVYTISWFATFDNGQHMCPSTITPSNTAPNPYIVTVVNK
jgi:hypothetical protein